MSADNYTRQAFFSGGVSVSMESSPTNPVEGDSVTLTCSNTSTSLPADYIPLTQYRWWRDGAEIEPGDPDYPLSQPGNSRLSISSVSREDHGLEYRCQGREEGSNFTGGVRLTMDVACKTVFAVYQFIMTPNVGIVMISNDLWYFIQCVKTLA